MGYTRYYQTGVTSELENILALAQENDSHLRCIAANQLGHYGGRRTLLPLVRLAMDSDFYVRQDALIGLGVSRDSRAYFFLANYYQRLPSIENEKEGVELRRRILNAFQVNRDRRGLDLVELAKKDPLLRGMAEHTSACIRKGYPEPFAYSFLFSEEERIAATEHRGIRLQNLADLEAFIPQLEMQAKENIKHFEKPQTYVVNMGYEFLVSGNLLHEHVQVAGGQNIVAAGEAFFDVDDKGWYIREINNRSTGYYPDASCYVSVRKALHKSKIRHPAQIKTVYPLGGWMDEDLLQIQWDAILRQI